MWIGLDLFAFFKSSHKFLTGLRSALWLSHTRPLILLFLSYSRVALPWQFGLLSCWKTNLPHGRFLANCIRFSSRISLYFASFVSPSILTSLLQRREPHSMTLPPPRFMVEIVFFMMMCSVWLTPDIVFSHRTFSQLTSESPTYIWQTVAQMLWILFKKCFLFATLPRSCEWWIADVESSTFTHAYSVSEDSLL